MPAKGPTGKADVLFSKLVRERGGNRCWAVGYKGPRGQVVECYPVMQCAHIISRRYYSLRWRFDNAVCMCAAHHAWFTNHPREWDDYVVARGVDLEALDQEAQFGEPEKPVDALARLKKVAGGG